MAYKLQVGNAQYTGDLTQQGNIDTKGLVHAITGATLQASAQIVAGTDGIESTGDITIDDGAKLMVRNAGDKIVQLDVGATAGRVKLMGEASAETLSTKLSIDQNSNGYLLLCCGAGADKFTVTDGSISSSAGATLTGDGTALDIDGNLTIGGNLTINSYFVNNVGAFSTDDQVLQLADGFTDDDPNAGSTIDESGFLFGHAGADTGAILGFVDTGNGGSIVAGNGELNGFINFSASVYIGGGGGVTNIPGAANATNPAYAVASAVSGGTLVVGLNRCGAGLESGVVRLKLPSLQQYEGSFAATAGDSFRIKVTSSACSATNHVLVIRNDADSLIDGEASFTLTSPYAAVEVVCLNVSSSGQCGRWAVL